MPPVSRLHPVCGSCADAHGGIGTVSEAASSAPATGNVPAQAILVHVLFVLVGTMPFVPSPFSFHSIAFILTLFLLTLCVSFNGAIRLDATALQAVAMVFLWMPINFLVSVNNEIKTQDFIRGAVPFVFILYYIVHLNLPARLSERASGLLLLAAAAWAVQIVALNATDLVAAVRGEVARLTYAVGDLLVPFGLVGFILVLYERRLALPLRAGLLALFLVLILASGYRSQILLVAAVTAFSQRRIWSVGSLAAVAGLGAVLAWYLTVNPGFVEVFVQRMQASTGDQVRAAERAFALESFALAPVLGNGLGFRVPWDATRPGMLPPAGDGAVGYIHNFAAYLLMTMGLTGLAAYGLFFARPLWIGSVAAFRKRDREAEAAWLCLVALLVYFLISAAFRQIQMWIVIGVLIAIIETRWRLYRQRLGQAALRRNGRLREAGRAAAAYRQASRLGTTPW